MDYRKDRSFALKTPSDTSLEPTFLKAEAESGLLHRIYTGALTDFISMQYPVIKRIDEGRNEMKRERRAVRICRFMRGFSVSLVQPRVDRKDGDGKCGGACMPMRVLYHV